MFYLLSLLLFACSFFTTCEAGQLYEIEFLEGHYAVEEPHGHSDPIIKQYLAKVTVRIQGEETLVVRGSTIPDAPYYDQFVQRLEGKRNITDNDIAEIESDVESANKNAINATSAIINPEAQKSLDATGDVVTVLSRVPVLWSGKYAFKMGTHDKDRCYVDGKQRLKKGIPVCPLGHPYVPRLLGGPNSDDVYDARTNFPDEGRNLCEGCYLQTINRNNSQSQRSIANGVNVHNGLSAEALKKSKVKYRGSEGCLTIAPKQWDEFWRILPTPEQWEKAGHKGVITIVRPNPPMPPGDPKVEVQ